MPQTLVVVRPFAGRARGDMITDAQEIAKILACEWRTHVVRVAPNLPAAAVRVTKGD